VLFNRNGTVTNITCSWTNIGLQAGAAMVRDLWGHTNLGTFVNSFTTNVPSHSAVMLKIIGTPPVLPGLGTNYLSDLQSVYAYVGWGAMTKDKSIGGNPITLGGVAYSKGLGVHAFSGVEYDLGGVASRFRAVIGVDNEDIGQGPGSVDFQVYADGLQIYDSGVMLTNTPAQSVDLDVTGVSRLVLGVDDADDNNNYDHADWANAMVIVTNTTPVPPPIPVGLTAKPQNGINLSWNASLSATGYKIKRSTDGGNSYTVIGTSPVAVYPDTNLIFGMNYYYVVSATNQFGESSNSASVSATACSYVSSPTNVLAAATISGVTVNWNTVPGATSYSVARSTAGTPYVTIATGLTGTNYFDTTTVGGNNYYYTVTAVNSCNQSPPSTFVAATAPSAQIALLDGASAIVNAASTSISQPCTVSSGASVLVVLLADKNSTQGGDEPSTLSWNGQTLAQAGTVASGGASGGGGGSARECTIYYLYSPPAGTANITGTLNSSGASSYWLSAYTLVGVNTNIAPATAFAGTGNNVTSQQDSVATPSGSWAAVASTVGATSDSASITVTPSGTAITAADTGHDSSSITMGYVSGLTATNSTFTSSLTGTATKITLVEAVFSSAPAWQTSLSASPGSRQVGLTWNAFPAALSYNVNRSTISGNKVTITNVASTSYIDTGLTNGTKYYYTVTAVTATGPSASTIEVVATPLLAIRRGIGFNSFTLWPTATDLQLQKAAGFTYCRMDFSWSSIETTPGVYNFGAYDSCVSSLQQVGMTPLFIFDYANPLYDGGYSPYDQAGRTAYANFTVAAVKHYQGLGIIWEIYNEPTGFWTFTNGTTGDPGNATSVSNCAVLFAPLAIQVSAAIKNAYPNEIVVAPAMSYTDQARQPFCSNALNFLQMCYQAGMCSNLNAISIHPYRQSATQPEFCANDYVALRNQINNTAVNISGVNPPLINTESGFSAVDWGTTSGLYKNPTNTPASAEKSKAMYTARLLLSDQMNAVKVSIIYDWQEGSPPSYGMVDSNDVPVNTYYAIKTFSAQTAGYTYSSFTTNANSDYILTFTNGSQKLYVAWSEFGTADVVTIPVGSNIPVVVTSYDGSSVKYYVSGAGGYSCTLNNGPQYINQAVIQASNSGKSLQLTWPPNGTLLQATNLTGQWVTNQSLQPLTVTPTNRQMFYRVKWQ